MVAGKDHPRHPSDGNPAGCLQRLRCLVDEERSELLAFKQTIGRAHECRSDDTGLTEKLGIDADFQLDSPLLQPLHLLVVFLVTPFTMGTEFTDGLSDGPEHLIVGMSLKTSFVSKRQHLVVHARGITYS